ncbi:MAG: hydantoinase B/oxoprolinase family protein [Zetaproteobacteria bacterium]|nr:MAG: hydantoinase B/oxoprolinase family protein [Zetaproteobacteria bacterium]
MNAVDLSLFSARLDAICAEMGAILRRSAVSPNIRDRGDYSCALFDGTGELVAQAAHIPVHLGSMAFAMRDVVRRFDWRDGDLLLFNDPRLGGTHLPDITAVMPLCIDSTPIAFAVSRAHHADVGGLRPGSMGLCSRLEEEGVVLAPDWWWRAGEEQPAAIAPLLARARNPEERRCDLSAQRAACMAGVRRLRALHEDAPLPARFARLMAVSERYGRRGIAAIPDGCYRHEELLDDDGLGHGPLPLRVALTVSGTEATVDFTGTAPACAGPFNCPLAVTAAAVYYLFRCLMPPETPQTAAVFRPIRIIAEPGSLLHAVGDVAVAGGNVETSQRVVDLLLGALARALPGRMPAQSQGTMNNVLFGGDDWVYYETLGGGMGASPGCAGQSAVQCHMTNTANTSIELLEMHYPLRVERYAVRRGSGGAGRHRGGDGLIRSWRVLSPCALTLLSERRSSAPQGAAGGAPGAPGENLLLRDGRERRLPAKCELALRPGDLLTVATPGGGGWGAADAEEGR